MAALIATTRPTPPAGRSLQGGSGPLALPEYRHAPAVGIKSVDIDLVRADHPVDVDQAGITALGCNLLRRQVGAIEEALRIALAKRDVAGSVLVEQRIEEQQPAL